MTKTNYAKNATKTRQRMAQKITITRIAYTRANYMLYNNKLTYRENKVCSEIIAAFISVDSQMSYRKYKKFLMISRRYT